MHKKLFSFDALATFDDDSKAKRTRLRKLISFACAALLGAGLVLSAPVAPRAQRSRELPVNVTGISSRASSNGATYTIMADGALTRAQTWQDGNEFNVVLYRGQSGIRVPRGVQARRVGDSLMLTFPVRPGASVALQTRFNRLDLVMSGGSGAQNNAGLSSVNLPETNARGGESRVTRERAARTMPESTSRQNSARRRTADEMTMNHGPARERAGRESEIPLLIPTQNQNVVPNEPANGVSSSEEIASLSGTTAPPSGVTTPATTVATQTSPAGDDWTSYIFSTTGLVILAAIAALLLLVVLMRRRRKVSVSTRKTENIPVDLPNLAPLSKGDMEASPRNAKQVNYAMTGKGEVTLTSTSNNQGLQKVESRVSVAQSPVEVFGAFRVDQEVTKLVLGEAHRMDVLGSRAADDRRALEASLLKSLHAPTSGPLGSRRARTALEEYGFVARLSASTLLGRDTYERATAARALGEIKSPASLPFLLEALYDRDQSVRTEAVSSLGAMQSPAAIGALLDMARRYPDMPASLLSSALTRCSVESLNFFDEETPAPHLAITPGAEFTGEINQLDPVEEVESLPEWSEDAGLRETLEFFESAESADAEMRSLGARRLAEYRTRASVEMLAKLVASDPESVVRSSAVVSLGEVDHESVFVPILLALTDEAREVRAAAARALSRLNLDRADAYTRAAATSDEETMSRVARACTEAGLTGQAIDRVASDDRRQAYEAFALTSLIARAGEFEPLFAAIEKHPDVKTRLGVVRVLGLVEHPALIEGMRRLSVREGLPEDVRTAILEAVYKIDGLQVALETDELSE